MQIAGSRCVICDQTVGVIREGTACISCKMVYHSQCLKGPNCPHCGQPLLAGHLAHALPSAFEQTKRERPTSEFYVNAGTEPCHVNGQFAFLSAL
jgi:hypothetical protein